MCGLDRSIGPTGRAVRKLAVSSIGTAARSAWLFVDGARIDAWAVEIAGQLPSDG